MRKRVTAVLAGMVLALVSVSGREAASSPGSRGEQGTGMTFPAVSGQVTFLYFNDIERAAKFYSEALGLKSTFDQGWVRIYAVSPSSFVGLVRGNEGMLRPASEKPVMVSIVVDGAAAVDGWYTELRNRGVTIPEPPNNQTRVPVRSFAFKDPEGYTLEVFCWLKN